MLPAPCCAHRPGKRYEMISQLPSGAERIAGIDSFFKTERFLFTMRIQCFRNMAMSCDFTIGPNLRIHA